MKFILTASIIATSLVAIVACNGHDSGNTVGREGSTWPKNSNANMLDSMVITHLTEDQLMQVAPIQGPNIVNFQPTFSKAQLGWSLNSATKNVMGKLIEFEGNDTEIRKEYLGETQYDFQTVSDYYDLVKKFNLDVSASVKYFGFRMDARYQMSKSLKINRFHQYVAARVYVKDRRETLKHNNLTAAALLDAKNKSRFVSKYGDQFFSGRIIGGDLIALIEIESSNTETRDANQTHIEAAYKAMGGNGAKVAVDVKNSLDEISKVSKYSIKLIYNGVLIGDSTKFTDIKAVKSLIDTIPQNIHKNGKIIEYEVSGIFSAVENLPQSFSAKDFVAIIGQSYQLATIENSINMLALSLPDLEYVIETPTFFSKGTLDSSKKIYNRNFQALRAYENNWKLCASAPELCQRCLIYKYEQPDYTPAVDSSKLPPMPIQAESEIPYNSNAFTTIAVVHSNSNISVSLEGKVQYKPTNLDCRVPIMKMVDFDIHRGFYVPSGSGVFRKTKLMPVIELQYFVKNGNDETPLNTPFYYTGENLKVPDNSGKDLILKGRMDLIWVAWDDDSRILYDRAVPDKIAQIQTNIVMCSGDKILAKINQL